ncbi:MAG TPA: nucleotide exchange factor GrpE [Candidatus Dormibacteraeota bacterium]|nr:nucleotide exchange factor GrpE [Candidatus Dormibacteraeota bacterium]
MQTPGDGSNGDGTRVDGTTPDATAPNTSPDAQAAPAEDEAAERYRRLAADFANYRRRSAEEYLERERRAVEPLVSDLLPAVDGLRRALAVAPPGDPLAEGVAMVLRQMEEVLRRHGVTTIATVGRPFDPQHHEAIAAVPDPDVERDTVVAGLRPGYALHDRVVRPALVSVARASPP